MFRSYSDFTRYDARKKRKPTPSQESFSCDLCDQSTWFSETDVQIHRKIAHSSEIHEQMQNHMERFCTICMSLHDSHSAMISHVKTRHLLSSPTARRVEREIFICMHCDCIFFNKGLLEAHIMYLHLWPSKERSSKTFTCPKCNKTCKLKLLWFHLQLHDIPSLSICEICLTHFNSIKELIEHLKEHPMYYKCEICNYHTTKELHFESHLDKHHSSPLKKGAKLGMLVREAFGKSHNHSYNSLLKYSIHHSVKGLALPKFIHICSLCREICTDKLETKLHLIRDHLKEEEKKKKIMCLCGEEFFNRVLLKQHIFKMKGCHQEVDGNKPNCISTKPSTMETVDVEVDHIDSPDNYMIQLEDIEPATQETEIVIDIDISSDYNADDTDKVPYKEKSFEREVPIKAKVLVETGVPIEMETEVPIEIETEVPIEMETEVPIEIETEVPIETETEFSQQTEGSDEIVDEKSNDEELTYIYAEISDDHLVTIDSETNEQIISF